jgi:gluconolactonase
MWYGPRNATAYIHGGIIMPSNLERLGLPAGLVAETAVRSAAFVSFTEGPAVDAEGNVFFSDIVNNRIMRRTVDGGLSVWRADSSRANGNMFDAQGRLVTCEGAEFGEGGRRRLTRTDLRTGEVEVLTERYEGKRYNSPNDLVIDSRGRTYFTDPRYKADRSDLEMDVEAVYRRDPDGRVARILSQPVIQKPNGITISTDNHTLYLVDSNPAPGGNRKIWAFDLSRDGIPSGQRLVYDFAPGRGGDGMRTDAAGNLWIAAGISHPRHANETAEVPAGVYVMTPGGELVGRIPVPEDAITNLAFGGPDLKTLYIVAGKSLFSIRVNIAGHVMYPPVQVRQSA